MCRYLYKTGQSLEYNPDFVARAGDLVLARASDGYWYRAVVADSDNLLAVTVSPCTPHLIIKVGYMPLDVDVCTCFAHKPSQRIG